MSEILTESFCERCGTRYTFETHTPRAGRFGKLKVLSKGLKNYVLSDESSLDEALADARSDQDRAASGQQLDAFHKTFNFCMSCRQYTCANCWNEVESRCLSCAPHLGHEVLEAPFQTADPFGRIASIGAEAVGNGHEPDLETLLRGSSANATAWPETDVGVSEPVEEPSVEAEPEADAVTRLDSLFAIATQPDEPARDVAKPTAAEPPAVAPPQPAAASAEPTRAKPPAVAPTPAEAPPAPKAASPGKPAKPARDIALEVSLFEEDAAHDGAEAVFTVPEPLTPAAEIPQVAADVARPAMPSGESDELDDRTAAAMSQTADLLARFRTTSGVLPAAPAQPLPPAEIQPEPVVPAAAAEPAPTEPTAAPAEQPVAAEPARPRVDRIEAPTWHVDTPPAPALPNGHPPEPAIIPTPGPALRPSVQARWPATPPKDAPSSPVPTALPPAAPIPPQTPPPAVQATALPAAPEAEPQWPAAPAWPAGEPSSTSSWPIDPSAAPSWPASQPGAAGSWPAGQSRASRVTAVDAIWAASSRDVLNRPETGVQACVNCGLPLSSTARFCRRCGANQLQA
jgi:peptide methionine sulfoxide reductase MsrB